jgi:hypothetical protein
MDRAFTAITSRLRVPSPQRQREIEHRANALARLRPTEYIVGSGMNYHYFGAKFGENIVAFENIDYGNALYILFDNWQEISQIVDSTSKCKITTSFRKSIVSAFQNSIFL